MTTSRIARSAITAAAATLAAAGIVGVAQFGDGAAPPVMQFTQAQSTDATTSTTATSSGDTPAAKKATDDKGRRAPLDAETEAQVKEAALGAVPGATYKKGRQDRQGDGYHALVTKTDGTRVLVRMDAAFKVTSVTDPAPRRGHKAHLDASTEAKVKEAALAAVPGATYRHGHQARDGQGYKALLVKADDTKVLVHLDTAFKVTSVEDPAPVGGRGRGHGKRGDAPAAAPAASPSTSNANTTA